MRSCAAVLLLLVVVGCPIVEPPDAGPGGDAGPAGDAGQGDDDAGAGGDDGGPSGTDAGPVADDGGPVADAGSCDAQPVCGDTVPTLAVSFAVGGGAPQFGLASAATLTVGSATRADVEALFGAGTAGENPFRAWHCAYGIQVQYVDDKDGDDFEGNASAGDVVARVVAFEGALLTSTNGVEPGDTRAFAQAALGSPSSTDFDEGGFDASASDGMSVVSDGAGVVTAVALFKPQAAAHFDLPIDVNGAAIGSGPTRLTKGDSLTLADSALGAGYDAQGVITVEAGVLDPRYLVRVYAAYGIRLVALCGVTSTSCPSNGDKEITYIALSPPFVGVAPNGLALGATLDEVTALYGQGTPSSDSDDLVEYATGGEKLGVGYVTDPTCTRRAGALLLGYDDPTN